MAKIRRFSLKTKKGDIITNLDELRNCFEIESALDYYEQGKLYEWLNSHGYIGEATSLSKLNKDSPNFEAEFYGVLGLQFDIESKSFYELKELLSASIPQDELSNEKQDDSNAEVIPPPNVSSTDAARESLIVDTMISIGIDENKSYENKEIYIRSFIKCDGKISFSNCIVHFNETSIASSIIMASEAEMYAEDTVFVCHGVNENFFIRRASDTVQYYAHFYDCKFVDALFFIKDITAIRISDCILENCRANFIHSENAEYYLIENSKILLDGLSDFNQNESGYIINMGKYSFSPRPMNDNYNVENVHIEVKSGAYKSEYKLGIFYSPYASFKKCHFINSSHCIKAASVISECEFNNCKECISDGECITQSNFIECHESNLVTIRGSAEISYCEFIDCNGIGNSKQSQLLLGRPPALIVASAFCRKVNVRNCIFKNIKLNDMSGFYVERLDKCVNTVMYIENSDFIDCSVAGMYPMIIRESEYYRVNKKKILTNMVSISGCKGI